MTTSARKPVVRSKAYTNSYTSCLVIITFIVAAFTLPLLLVGGYVTVVVAGILATLATIMLIRGLYALLRIRSNVQVRVGWKRLPVVKVAGSSGVIALCVVLMVHVLGESDEQRCINGQTMTVIPSSQCDDGSGPAFGTSAFLSIDPEWYYGGTGLQIGDQVQGGSLTAPAGWGGGSGGGGSDGSDDGSDGDSGGDDGGGGDGGE